MRTRGRSPNCNAIDFTATGTLQIVFTTGLETRSSPPGLPYFGSVKDVAVLFLSVQKNSLARDARECPNRISLAVAYQRNPKVTGSIVVRTGEE